MKNNYKGQIMVIILLVLSILTIIAVGVSLNTARDTKEQVQDKQYQQYYSVGERNIVDFINYLGKKQLSSLFNGLDNGSLNINNLNYNCNKNSNILNCTVDNITSDYFNESGTEENLTTIITIEDFQEIPIGTVLTLRKDQDLLFDFINLPGISSLKFKWQGNNVAWDMSLDYYILASNEYITDKLVWDKNGIYNNNLEVVNSPLGCFRANYVQANNEITINNISCNNKQFLRIKPVMKNNDTIDLTGLSISGANTYLIRKVTSTTTSRNSGTIDNPSVVLETTYFLGESPLSLFDYVLRTEGDIIKD